jgi:hypothetical protein
VNLLGQLDVGIVSDSCTHSLNESRCNALLGCSTDTQTQVSVRSGVIELDSLDSCEIVQPSNGLGLIGFGLISSLGHQSRCLVVLVVEDV